MSEKYKAGDTVFGNWKLVRLIGEGSFGQVFEAEREDFGRTYKAAIKIITIPQSQSEIQSVQADGLDDESVTAYFRSCVEELVDEFGLMSQLKGHSNIVSYEDHTVQPHAKAIGWDILIRMELLTPLLRHVRENTMTQRDVIKLGIDLCKALELCQKYNIVHRDIKPENIFISPAGDYKLGDFGIARTVEKTTSGLSKKGTYTYMAPEIYRDQPYGTTVDIYSLGVVLYWLLNESRSPFLPPYPAPITHADRENALRSRMSGEPIPAPKNADGRLAEIVLKACAYDPKDRYSSPMLMRQELEGILYDRKEAAIIFPEGDEVPARSVHEIPTYESSTPEEDTERAESAFSARVDKTTGPFDHAPLAGELEEKTESVFSSPVSDKTVGPFDRSDELEGTEENTADTLTVEEEPFTETKDPLTPLENADTLKPAAKGKKGNVAVLIAIVVGLAAVFALGLFLDLSHFTQTVNLTEEEIYSSDGTLSKINYYDEMGHLVQEKGYLSDGAYYIVYYDEAGNEARVEEYNEDGTLVGYAVGCYDEMGNLTEREWYNGDGTLEGCEVNYYDEAGNLTLYEEYDGDRTRTRYCAYSYDEAGNNTRFEEYNGDGTLDKYCLHYYDDEGNWTHTEYYNADGTLNDTTYDNGAEPGSMPEENTKPDITQPPDTTQMPSATKAPALQQTDEIVQVTEQRYELGADGGGTYTGDWKSGKPHGIGSISYDSGDFYTGSWENGQKSGQGKKVKANGNTYEGAFANDVYSGQGKYTWADGRLYEGEFSNGTNNGQGTMIYTNGDIYTGSFSNGDRSGYGAYTQTDGTVYEGEWANNIQAGQGTARYADGKTYTGAWVNGKANGQGTMVNSDGDVYTGNWFNDHMVSGTKTNSNGDVYQLVNGNWEFVE